MRYIGILALAITALIGISFAVLNRTLVPFDYYLGTKQVPLSYLLVAAFLMGVVMGMLSFIPRVLRLKLQIRRLRRGKE